jgi:hypothetical protein
MICFREARQFSTFQSSPTAIVHKSMALSGISVFGKKAQKLFQDAKGNVESLQQGTSHFMSEAQRKVVKVATTVGEQVAKSADTTTKAFLNTLNPLPESDLVNPHLTAGTLSGAVLLGLPFTKFTHPLLTDGDSIRLIRILPGCSCKNRPGDLVIRLEMKQFTRDDCPRYHALSYTWGSSPKTTPIIVNGQVHQVRQNLLQFLEIKRGPNPSQVSPWCWIDALCINQEDIEERNRTVQRMKNIYERSQQVIIWLGAGDLEMEKNFVALEDLKQQLQQLIETANDPGGPQIPFESDITASTTSPSGNSRHRKIFYHPYWSRGWILQEASTPRRLSWSTLQDRSSVFIYYGLHTISMESFLFAFESLERESKIPLTSSYGLRVKTPFKRIASVRWFRDANDMFGPYPPVDLIALLTHARACEVTNPRDRLYALLAIATDGTDFTVDYSKSVADIYHEFAKTIILRDNNLDILGFSSGIQNLNQLPSWVSDWTVKKVAEPLPKRRWELKDGKWITHTLYSASKGLPINNDILENDRCLNMKGIVFDKIQFMHNGDMDFLDLNGGASTPYVTGDTRLEAFRHILTADINAIGTTRGRDCHPFAADLNIEGNTLQVSRGAAVPWPEYMDSKEMALAIVESVKGNREMIEEVEKQIPCGELITGILEYRVFITTERGYMGVTADTTKPGDLVCIIRGAQVPLILRESGDGTTFKFVGDCYIHGIMDGEAVDEQYEQREGIFAVS